MESNLQFLLGNDRLLRNKYDSKLTHTPKTALRDDFHPANWSYHLEGRLLRDEEQLRYILKIFRSNRCRVH